MSEPQKFTASVSRNEIEAQVTIDRRIFDGVASRACQSLFVRPVIDQREDCTVFRMPAYPGDEALLGKAQTIVDGLRAEGILSIELDEEVYRHQILA